MKRYSIDLDTSKCISCGACAVACMDQNDLAIEDGVVPFRRVFDTERVGAEGPVFGHYSVGCLHCEDAPCISACPCACLEKDPLTNFTIVDNTDCIGCHSCAMACPYGIPGFGTDGRMIKCSGCFARVHQGLLPACVKTCPVGALRLVDLDEDSPIASENSLRFASQPMLEAQV